MPAERDDRMLDLVLEELRLLDSRMGNRLECLDEKITQVRVEVAGLKVKSGVWGALAGLLPSICVLVWVIVKNL